MEEKKEEQKTASNNWWPNALKIFGFTVAIGFGLVILLFIFRILTLASVYHFFLGKISVMFGVDHLMAALIALALTAVSILVMPFITSYILFGRKKMEVVIGTLAVVLACGLAIHFGTKNVFFDPDGKPLKYYIKTLEGFKFSSEARVDPTYGVKYKPVSDEIIKEIKMWERTGKLNIPQVVEGKYFDRLTGEPIVWYLRNDEGKIMLYPLPGYDEETGKAVKIITPDIIKERKEQKAKALAEELAVKEKAEAENLIPFTPPNPESPAADNPPSEQPKMPEAKAPPLLKPVLVVYPDSLEIDFGRVALNLKGDGSYAFKAPNRIITIENKGNAPLEVSRIENPPWPFLVVENHCQGTILPHERCKITVRYSPTHHPISKIIERIETHKESITIKSNDTERKVFLVGSAVSPPSGSIQAQRWRRI